jgi:hypothetical protein
MKKTLLSLILTAAVTTGIQAQQTVALWTFEDYTVPTESTPGTTLAGILPEVGSGEGSGFHTIAATAWTTPAGNGSPKSLNSNNWGIGDYYQFQVSTLGLMDIGLSFDATRSGTGPDSFRLDYSTDGENFATHATFTVLNNHADNGGTWGGASPYRPAYFLSYDLGSLTGLNDQSEVYFRLVATVAGAAAGTMRVDNVHVTAVPEPGTLALFGGFGLLMLMFLRKRR